MKKLNEVIYNKLLLQANEAQVRGMKKLASGVLNAIGPVPEDEALRYNFSELQDDVYNGLWKLAAYVMKYHDLESVDATKVHDVLESFAEKLIEQVEQSLGVDDTQIGPLEEKIPGEI